MRAYLPGRDPRAVREAVAGARTALGHLQAFGLRPIADLTTRVVHEADWAQAWKAFFPVLHIGRRVVIRPTWRRHRRAAGEIVLALDPGMAFGTGLHPTTRLCLEGLERLADAGLLTRGAARDGSARVLDVGIGSGILAIAAGLFGAGELVGVDPDQIAVDASIANARRNRLAGRLNVRAGSLPSGSGPFDIVCANLIASVLVALAPQLRDELRPGGSLLASGIFIDREPEVREAFAEVGLRVVHRSSEAEWVALTAVRDERSAIALAPPAAGAATIGRMSLFPVLLVVHIALAISVFLPSVLLPFALRTGSRGPGRARRGGSRPAFSRCRGPARSSSARPSPSPGSSSSGPLA